MPPRLARLALFVRDALRRVVGHAEVHEATKLTLAAGVVA